MYIYVYINIHIYIYIYVYMYTYIYMCVCLCACLNLYLCSKLKPDMCVCRCICVCICTRVKHLCIHIWLNLPPPPQTPPRWAPLKFRGDRCEFPKFQSSCFQLWLRTRRYKRIRVAVEKRLAIRIEGVFTKPHFPWPRPHTRTRTHTHTHTNAFPLSIQEGHSQIQESSVYGWPRPI